MNQVVAIAGMHRSGTSLLASWLHSCGLVLGDGNTLGSSSANPHGHFEDMDFVTLHEEIINKQYPNSFGWKVAQYQPLSFNEEFCADRALSLVCQRNKKYPQWGWKDPRTTLFLDQWKQDISELKVILVWRPLGEVVSSLLRRSRKMGPQQKKMRIGTMQAVRLWKNYNEHALEYRRKYPADTLLIPLSALIEDDATVFDFIREKLSLTITQAPLKAKLDSRLMNYPERNNHKLRLFELLFQCTNLELELSKLSDL